MMSEQYPQLYSLQHIFLRFEDLVNITTRYSTLRKVIEFIDLPSLRNVNLSDNQLACAFMLAESPHVKRERIHSKINSTLVGVK